MTGSRQFHMTWRGGVSRHVTGAVLGRRSPKSLVPPQVKSSGPPQENPRGPRPETPGVKEEGKEDRKGVVWGSWAS